MDLLPLSARSGLSGAIVVHGEAYIAESALLGYAAQLASGTRVLRVSGEESKAEVAPSVRCASSCSCHPHMPLTGASELRHGLTRCSRSCHRAT